MSRTRGWVSKLVVMTFVLGAAIAGCGGDDDEGGGGAAPAPGPCAAGTRECVNPGLARVCTPEAKWIAKSCHASERCEGGECIADTVEGSCKPDTGSCLSPTSGLRCKPDLKGFAQVTCPTGTTCADGLCVGACVVGSSKCLGNGRVATCADGRTFVEAACNAGELCVTTSGGGAAVSTAACKPAECFPRADSCTRTCGNVLDPAADQTKSVTDCLSTPDGFRYRVQQCTGYETCNPTASACGAGKSNAACASDCVAGTVRCSPDRLGTQTCGTDGKWEPTVAPCNTNLTNGSLVCLPKPDDGTKVVCGDPQCALSPQTVCEGDLVRKCDADGRLGAPVACTNGGTCKSNAQVIAGREMGACSATCQTGEERCSGNSYQGCVNGSWGAFAPCPASPVDGGALLCVSYSTPQGRAKVCNAECAPGARRCRTNDGSTVGTEAVQVCDAQGKWATAQGCTVGSCVANGGVAASCVAECIPNQVVCTGAAKDVNGANAVGTDSFGTCTAQGRLPAALTTCTGSTACRKGPSGQAIAVAGQACLECVGPNVAGGNERGLSDVRCVAADGSPGNAASETCSAANTWGAPQACGGTAKCSFGICSDLTEFSGVAVNLSSAGLVGWSQCFASPYGQSVPVSTILTQCTGSKLMMGCRQTGTDSLLVAAYAPRADVTFNTSIGNTTHVANGVGWYFYDGWSWGFAPAGAAVSRSFCDTQTSTASTERLCWETLGTGSGRCGSNLNLGATYERVMFQAN